MKRGFLSRLISEKPATNDDLDFVIRFIYQFGEPPTPEEFKEGDDAWEGIDRLDLVEPYSPFGERMEPANIQYNTAEQYQPSFKQLSLPEALNTLSPLEQYLLRVEDYLNQEYQRQWDALGQQYADNPMQLADEQKALTENFKQYFAQIQDFVNKGVMPAQLPYYQESKNIYGKAVTDWYNKYVNQSAKTQYAEQQGQRGMYGGYPTYGEYVEGRTQEAAQKGLSLTPPTKQDFTGGFEERNITPYQYISPQEAFTGYGRGRDLTENNLTAALQRGQTEGVSPDLLQYGFRLLNQPVSSSTIQGNALFEAQVNVARAINRELDQRQEQGNIYRSQYYAGLYPEWLEKYKSTYGPEVPAITAPGEAASGRRGEEYYTSTFLPWFEKQPEFKQLKAEWRNKKLRETPITLQNYEKYLEDAFKSGIKPEPWESWTTTEPAMDIFKQESMRAFQNKQRAAVGLAPRTRFLSY